LKAKIKTLESGDGDQQKSIQGQAKQLETKDEDIRALQQQLDETKLDQSTFDTVLKKLNTQERECDQARPRL
jgi:prefoldin subunit 5